MSSICWPQAEVRKAEIRGMRRTIGTVGIAAAIWFVNLTILAAGAPFLVYSRLRSRPN